MHYLVEQFTATFDNVTSSDHSGEGYSRMSKILIAVVTSIALAGVAGCTTIGKGKGKGKAPPPVYEEPAPAPVYK
jgi:hypothetical protein